MTLSLQIKLAESGPASPAAIGPDMATALYNFAEVDARTAKPSDILHDIRQLLLNNQAAWSTIERYIRPPGRCGSRQFDQCRAVIALLEADEAKGGHVAAYLREHDSTERDLWQLLQRVIRRSGFQMSHGRLLGVDPSHEVDPTEKADEAGQPDIE